MYVGRTRTWYQKHPIAAVHNNLGDAPDAGIELVKQVVSLIRDEGLSAKGTYCISQILTRCAARLLRLFADTHYERLTLFFFTISDKDVLATIDATARVTAMLEAGRVSLDNYGKGVLIQYSESAGDLDADLLCEPVGIALE